MRLDVADVAKLLKVPENQVYHWINENHLPAIEVAGKYCFNRSDSYSPTRTAARNDRWPRASAWFRLCSWP